MLKRDYMDYHSDRFEDFSLMFYENDKLIAVMPAAIDGSELKSHSGLTYGGIITDLKMTTPKMLSLFTALKLFLKNSGITKLIYKRVPSIYHSYPSDEDLYALFIHGANLLRRDISTSVLIPHKIQFNERRRRNIKKAIKAELRLKVEDDNFAEYMELLAETLKKQHNATPVHTTQEIVHLAENFPNNIKLFSVYKDDQLVSGAIIFETDCVAHAQYIASNDIGRETGGLDFLFDYLINDHYQDKRYFDFGISNENNGQYLNTGLITQKQEFGGLAIAHDFYEIAI